MFFALLAGWANARYWGGYYSKLGVALSQADYLCFSQRASLIPPFVMPLMIFSFGVTHTGVCMTQNIYRYSSRAVYWRMLCRDALSQALVGGAALVAGSLLPAIGGAYSIPTVNWCSAQGLFALMAGGPMRRDVSLPLVFAGNWVAACLQLMAGLLLYGVLECRFRAFPAFAIVLVLCMALSSPVRQSVWDLSSLRYRCWRNAFDMILLLTGWLICLSALFFAGLLLYRKVDLF